MLKIEAVTGNSEAYPPMHVPLKRSLISFPRGQIKRLLNHIIGTNDAPSLLSTDKTNNIGVCVYVCVCPQQHEPNLLPEVNAHDQGKICVVIDLDETLVHSSFKVHNQTDIHTTKKSNKNRKQNHLQRTIKPTLYQFKILKNVIKI